IDPAVADGSAIPIEERGPEEVTGFGVEQWAPAGTAVRHPAFDITPAGLVTALVTEAGIVERPDAAAVTALLKAVYRRRPSGSPATA
ncbi:MAG TPA: hypothetical protein DD491_15055, partial [Halieaceae bacterium]|nr:hypothetical protein [Halieaceae bacterium]